MRDLLRNPRHSSVLLAYGITAAGKTYTVEGGRGAPGVLPRALEALYSGLAQHAEPVAVRVSHYEVSDPPLPGAARGAGGGTRLALRGERPASAWRSTRSRWRYASRTTR